MNKDTYDLIENYMLSCMEDSAHDKEHVYRVLYNALEIAKSEKDVNYDILVGSCLLHDIGRKEQFENPKLCHAMVGGDKAPSFFQEYKYKLENLYENFYTERGAELTKERQHAAVEFYNNLYKEVNDSYKNGKGNLGK